MKEKMIKGGSNKDKRGNNKIKKKVEIGERGKSERGKVNS